MSKHADKLCARCQCEIAHQKRKTGAGSDVLQALNAGPRTVSQLAIGVYGYDSSGTRRKVSWLLKSYRDFVMPAGPGRWALAGRRHIEAAE